MAGQFPSVAMSDGDDFDDAAHARDLEEVDAVQSELFGGGASPPHDDGDVHVEGTHSSAWQAADVHMGEAHQSGLNHTSLQDANCVYYSAWDAANVNMALQVVDGRGLSRETLQAPNNDIVAETLENNFYTREMKVRADVVYIAARAMGLGEADEETICEAMKWQLSDAVERMSQPDQQRFASKLAAKRHRERIERLKKGASFFCKPAPARQNMLKDLCVLRRGVRDKIKSRAESKQILHALWRLWQPRPPVQQAMQPEDEQIQE